MKLIYRTHLTLTSLLILLWITLPSAASAQRGQFFRGEERARITEETQRLAGIQARYEKEIMAKPGVLGFGVGLDRERRELVFLVVVDKKIKMPELPKDIEDVRVMIERQEQDIFLHGAPACAQPCHANQLALPVQMGNSAFTNNFCSACTMGFKACNPNTQQRVYVTNSHCSTDANGCIGAAPIGTSTQHVSQLDATPQCSVGPTVGQVLQQAAPNCVAGVNNTVDATSIASTDGQTQISIRDIGVPSAFPGTVVVGDTVQKSGRTTGFTQGTVASTTFTVNIAAPGNCCNTATFVNQIRVDAIGGGPFIQGGDSGSALLNMDNEIVGLLFSGPANGSAGNANQINNVLNALGLTLDPLPCIECAAEAAASATSNPDGTMNVLYGVRDKVLKKSERGQAYVDLFYKHSKTVVGLMVRHPKLLTRTARVLSAHLDTLSTLVKKGETTWSREEAEKVSALLEAYAKVADRELRRDLRKIDADLKNAELLKEFGVQVR